MRLFTEHPATVGETYTEHMVQASSFGIAMLIGGVACLVHAVLPFAFLTTGSQIITRLHDRMVVNRDKQTPLRKGKSNDATASTGQA